MMTLASAAALPLQLAAALAPVWGGVVLSQAMRQGDDLILGLDAAGLTVLALAATSGLLKLVAPLCAAIAWRTNPTAAVLMLVAWMMALIGGAGLVTCAAREGAGLPLPWPTFWGTAAAAWLVIDVAAGWIPVAVFSSMSSSRRKQDQPNDRFPARAPTQISIPPHLSPATAPRNIGAALLDALMALVRMPLADAKRYGVLDRDGNVVTISQRSLARFIGVSESTVNKHLGRLNAQGVVSVSATDRQTSIVLTEEGLATIERSRTTGATS